MTGSLTPVQLHSLAVTLENEQVFYNAYRAGDPDCARARRDCIKYCANQLRENPGNGHDREHLRRYFDEQYSMPEATVDTYPELPLLEFWLDRVKYPVPDKAPPQEFGEVIIDSAVSQPTPLTVQEILMNKTDIIKIETKTYVNGTDVATLSDSEIYSLIAAQEAQVEELEKIKTKPKKLVAEIEKRKAGIQALVDYLDSKE